jgi:hypothetical protein
MLVSGRVVLESESRAELAESCVEVVHGHSGCA